MGVVVAVGTVEAAAAAEVEASQAIGSALAAATTASLGAQPATSVAHPSLLLVAVVVAVVVMPMEAAVEATVVEAVVAVETEAALLLPLGVASQVTGPAPTVATLASLGARPATSVVHPSPVVVAVVVMPMGKQLQAGMTRGQPATQRRATHQQGTQQQQVMQQQGTTAVVQRQQVQLLGMQHLQRALLPLGMETLLQGVRLEVGRVKRKRLSQHPR
jgi:hypothetical protein